MCLPSTPLSISNKRIIDLKPFEKELLFYAKLLYHISTKSFWWIEGIGGAQVQSFHTKTVLNHFFWPCFLPLFAGCDELLISYLDENFEF